MLISEAFYNKPYFYADILIQCSLLLFIFLMQVATGGVDGILRPTLDEKLASLHKKVATLAAEPKSDESEHIFENYFSSRTIRKLVLSCPTFASILWQTALEGNCKIWAEGHRCVPFQLSTLILF